MNKTIEKIALTLLNLFFITACAFVLVPILYALSVSLNAQGGLLGDNFRFIPRDLTFDHYRAVLFEHNLLLWFRNTAILAVASVSISLLVSVPGAYSLSRFRFGGQKSVVRCLLLLHAFPAILSMFAIFRLMSPMGLVNTRMGLLIIYIGTMTVFGLLNLKGYFDALPVEVEEAAAIDGAAVWNLIIRILLPLARPAVIVSGVMVLIFVWNEYIFAITFMTGAASYTLSAGLFSLQATEMTGSWPVFSAASIIVSLPILIIFFATQKYMTSGLTAGGVKG